MSGHKEIERRFLIQKPCSTCWDNIPDLQIWEIQQIYLDPHGLGSMTAQASEEDYWEGWRLRRTESEGHSTYTETKKRSISGITRLEEEQEISRSRYQECLRWQDKSRQPIEKTRYRFFWDGHILEVDCFALWKEIALLEIELPTETTLYSIPNWIQVLKEVTLEKRFHNSQLACLNQEEWESLESQILHSSQDCQ